MFAYAMKVEDYIQTDLLPLQFNQRVDFALGMMDEMKVSHLPLLNGDIFLGLVSEEQLNDVEDETCTLSNANIFPFTIFIGVERPIHDLLQVFAKSEYSMVPVLSTDGLYAGYISATKMCRELAKMLQADKAGGILIFEMAKENYHLSEIAHLLETEDVRIINLMTIPLAESQEMQIIIKVDTLDLARIVKTFSRFEYNVKASQYEDSMDLNQNDRYELLMKYLNF